MASGRERQKELRRRQKRKREVLRGRRKVAIKAKAHTAPAKKAVKPRLKKEKGTVPTADSGSA